MNDTNAIFKKIRKDLHKYPELSGQEYLTQQKIITFLKKYTNFNIVKVANTGVLATYTGVKAGKTILLRADIDALPIYETNTFDHTSTNTGVSHKCGHDGHTTILLGAAKMLAENPIEKGVIMFLFQPSEENGIGALEVLKDIVFKNLQIDYVFALHNLPGFNKHKIVVKEQEFTSNVKSIIITLQGKTAHAAEPEKGYNPANAIADIIRFSEEETNNKPAESDFFLVTPIHITMGEKAYGISAGYGEIHLTLRSWSTQIIEEKSHKLKKLLQKLHQQYNLNIEISWFEEFYANINDKEAVNIIKNAAKKADLPIENVLYPFKWGEDFGLFTQKYKGAIFGLGAGKNTPALHNPDYDFPDEITTTGITMFYNIIKESV
jgi:amidohydrolase